MARIYLSPVISREGRIVGEHVLLTGNDEPDAALRQWKYDLLQKISAGLLTLRETGYAELSTHKDVPLGTKLWDHVLYAAANAVRDEPELHSACGRPAPGSGVPHPRPTT